MPPAQHNRPSRTIFPHGREGIVEAEIRAARELGVRIVASRGSMDLGESQGGLPPDERVEEADHVLAETERLAALQDGDLVQIAPLVAVLVVAADKNLLDRMQLWKSTNLKSVRLWAGLAMIGIGILVVYI